MSEPQARNSHTAVGLETIRVSDDGSKVQIRRIGVLHHPKVPATRDVAHEIMETLRTWGYEALQESTWDEAALRALAPYVDLFLVLGGDGSTLRAARVAAAFGVPILGINMGRLGFLSELRPDTWKEKLPQVLRGDFWIEQRMMLQADLWRGGQRLNRQDALNDVVVSRGSLARVVRLHTDIDGGHLTTYVADGLICATPTGSTAYALAVGGPVLPPELRNILLIPIAPHLSFDRAVVLAQGAEVKIMVATDHQVMLTIDGQSELALQDGDRVQVRAGPNLARFARIQEPTYFYRTLMERLDPGKCRDEH